MSSCNALSVRWAISPIKTVGWAAKTSCNAAGAKNSESPCVSMPWAEESSCNAGAVAARARRQYPGCAARQACTRATLIAPWK